MANHKHITNHMGKRVLAFALAIVMAVTSWSVDWTALRVRAAGFDTPDDWNSPGVPISQDYQNSSSSDYEKLNGIVIHMAGMDDGNVLSFTADVWDAETNDLLGSGTVDGITAVQADVTINFSGIVLAPTKSVIIDLTCDGGDVQLYRNGSDFCEVITAAMSAPKTKVNIDASSSTSILTMDQVGQVVASTENPEYGRTIVYESSNPSVLTVNGSGVIEPVGPGKATITAKTNIDGDDAATIDVTVVEIAFGSDNLTYTGDTQTPSVTVTADRVLVAGDDYDVSGGALNVGDSSTVVVQGKGDYAGFSASKSFTVGTPADIASASGARYTIDTKTSDVTAVTGLKYNGHDLVYGTDFTATAERTGADNSDGTYKHVYTVTLEGMGNYTGIKEETGVKVTADVTTLLSDVYTIEFDDSERLYVGEATRDDVLNHITIRNRKGAAVGKGSFTITLSDENLNTPGTITATATYPDLYEGEISVEFTLYGKIQSTTITLEKNKWVYTGNAIKPNVTVKNGTTTLKKDTDYTISYSNNTDVGTATVKITGKGAYVGSTSKDFEIVPDIKDATVKVQNNSVKAKKSNGFVSGYSVVYSGSAQEPSNLVLNIDGTELTATDGDFTVAYNNNVNASTEDALAEIIITTSAGSICGTQTLTVYFTIEAKNISSATLTPDTSNCTYTGSAIEPPVIIKDGTKELVAGTDYELEYSNNVDAGPTAFISATGIGNYKGSVSKTFTIEQKDISAAVVTFQEAYSYTGSAIAPEEPKSVTLDGVTLVKGRDYADAITYSNNLNIGTATGKITGIGNYKGSATGTFNITARAIIGPQITYVIDRERVSEGDDGFVVSTENGEKVATYTAQTYHPTYKGRAQKPTIAVIDGDTTLRQGRDYTVTYGAAINASTVSVVIKGKGNYQNTGTITVKYVIEPCDLTDVSRISVNSSSFTAGDNSSVTVTDSATGDLVLDQDYTIDWNGWTNQTEAGPDKVMKIIGKGNYTGTREVTYAQGIDIGAAANSGVLELDDYLTGTYDDGATHQNTYGTTGIKMYNIFYRGGKTIDGNLPRIRVFAKLTELVGGEYDIALKEIESNGYDAGSVVEVTAKGKGTKYYGTLVAYYKIVPATLNTTNFKLKFEGDADYASASGGKFTKNYDYSGDTITPSFTLTYDPQYLIAPGEGTVVNTVEMALDRDYTYAPPTINGKLNDTTGKTGTLQGAGVNFTGSVEIAYTVGQANLAEAEIADIPTQDYTGSAIKPEPAVTYRGKTLKAGTDFTYSYGTNKEGTGTVTISGIGNYTGEKTKEFTIIRKTLDSNVRIVLKSSSQKYTGSEIELGADDITVMYDNNTQLVFGEDYKIDYANNVKPGKATITLKTGSNGLYATDTTNPATATFDIYLDLEDTDAYTISGIPNNREIVYYGNSTWKSKSDGSAFSTNQLQIKLTLDDTAIPAGAFAPQTSNLTEATSAGKITLNGAGADKFCVGSTTVDNVKIYIDASLLTVESTADVWAYTGQEVKPQPEVYYGNQKLTRDVDYTYGYELLGCPDYINVVADATSTSERAVYIIGKETSMFTGRTTNKNYSIKYDLSKAKETGWKTTYTYNEIQAAATAASKALADYRPTPVLTFRDNLGQDVAVPTGSYTATYASSNGDGTAFNNAGAIVTVNIIPNGTNSKCFGSKTLRYSVTGIDTANRLEVTLDATSFVYTGNKIEPGVTLVRFDGKDLDAADYTVKYANNVDVTTETSKAQVIVTGVGNYQGSTIVDFQITQKSIADEGSTVEPDFPVVTYTGKPITKEALNGFVLRDTANGKVLKPGTDADFTFSVKYGTNAGSATGRVAVTMNPGGNYKGSKDYDFDIAQLNLSDASLEVSGHSAEYTGSAVNPSVVLKMNIQGLDEPIVLDPATMYEVTYNGGHQMIDVGEYDMLIQPKTGNDNVTGSLSSKFTVIGRALGTADYKLLLDDDHQYQLTIDGKNYNEEFAYDYTGNPVKPAVTLKDPGFNNNEPLVEGVDYVVSYDPTNPVDATDAAKVIIEGKGNYSGRVEKTYSIGKSLGTITISSDGVSGLVYNGAPQKPATITVKDTKNNILRLNTDYTLEFSDDITSVGTKTVTAKGVGASGYFGEVSTTYVIKQKQVDSDAQIQIVPNLSKEGNNYYAEYTGQEIEPEVSVYVDLNDNGLFSEGEKLAASDYTVGYENNIEAGNALITVQLTGNYKSYTVFTKRFIIKGAKLSDTATTVIVNEDSYAYTGSEVTPNLTVYQDLSNGDRVELELNRDYKIASLKDNVNPGDATVTIRGIGSFVGDTTDDSEVSATFVIAADLATAFEVGENYCKVPTQLYTGAQLTPAVDAVIGEKVLTANTDFRTGNVTFTAYDSDGNPTAGTVDITGNNKYYRGTYTASFDITTDLSQIVLTYSGLYDCIYNGKEQKLTGFKIYDPSGNLVNYDADGVTYNSSTDGEACVNAGTITVTIPVTIGTVHDTVITQYDIKKAKIDGATYTGGANSTYTGNPLCPPVVLYYYGNPLKVNEDYTIVYDNNTKPTSRTSKGETPAPATITITGINNFEGTYTEEFQIYPERMREVQAKGSGANSVIVSWDKLDHVSGYRVDVMTTSSSAPFKTVDVKNPNTTSTTITGLSEGTSYSFRAYSYVTVEGTTYYGLLNSITTNTGIATPDIRVVSNTTGKATISWTVTNPTTLYQIFRSESLNGSYKQIARTGTGQSSFTDTGVKKGKTYYYKIRACRYPNEIGEFSNVSAVTVK